ncbi:MAG: hypothetical protein K2X08_03175 [Chlamydiales bacterium]|nr:hypothetical protein [Chlamydiales bacterium]
MSCLTITSTTHTTQAFLEKKEARMRYIDALRSELKTLNTAHKDKIHFLQTEQKRLDDSMIAQQIKNDALRAKNVDLHWFLEQSKYPINIAMAELFQKFQNAKNRFLTENEQFAINKARAIDCNKTTAEKIDQCTSDFTPIKREPPSEGEDEPDYLTCFDHL